MTKPTNPGGIILIGIGNEFRRDDGAGVAVARAFRSLACPGVTVREHRGEGLDLLDLWQGYAMAVLIDAVSSGGAPGTVYRVAVPPGEIPRDKFNCSTHAVSVAEAIELGRALGELPEKILVFGIEGKSFDHGPGLSPEVQSAVDKLVEDIHRELRDHARDGVD